MVTPVRIALVGLGKIARDQHVPALRGSADFALVAAASPEGTLPGLTVFPDLEALLDSDIAVEAVALCTPPQVRAPLARAALVQGLHVLLEKPPGMTVAEVQDLERIAKEQGRTLFAAWHSRHAAAVAVARDWLASRRLLGGTITWREDVRVWHPGQRWIWEAGGLGVFDPGINALSILTHLVEGALRVQDAELEVPANCAMPIAARLRLVDARGTGVEVDLDFRETGTQVWDIVLQTDRGSLHMSRGGAALVLDGQVQALEERGEYPELYARFARLIRAGECDVDCAPLRLVGEALQGGRRTVVPAFYD